MSPLVQARGAGVDFGMVPALRDVSLEVTAGERLALVGANGSGKSTLLRLLHGLLRPSAGQLLRQPGVAQAMVFQRPYMLRASARNNVAMGLWLAGSRWAAARHKADEALVRFQLDAVAGRDARALSGGQQQRLALARAWALSPRLLFLDEPTASLDPHAKRDVEARIDEFAQTGTTLVFASHNLGQVKRLATRVLYLEHGRIAADLPVDAFFDRALLPAVSASADLFLKGEVA